MTARLWRTFETTVPFFLFFAFIRSLLSSKRGPKAQYGCQELQKICGRYSAFTCSRCKAQFIWSCSPGDISWSSQENLLNSKKRQEEGPYHAAATGLLLISQQSSAKKNEDDSEGWFKVLTVVVITDGVEVEVSMSALAGLM
jgi:hypothetical protein